jgi:hypothetical protein
MPISTAKTLSLRQPAALKIDARRRAAARARC